MIGERAVKKMLNSDNKIIAFTGFIILAAFLFGAIIVASLLNSHPKGENNGTASK
jgi:hypothetical protein